MMEGFNRLATREAVKAVAVKGSGYIFWNDCFNPVSIGLHYKNRKMK